MLAGISSFPVSLTMIGVACVEAALMRSLTPDRGNFSSSIRRIARCFDPFQEMLTVLNGASSLFLARKILDVLKARAIIFPTLQIDQLESVSPWAVAAAVYVISSAILEEYRKYFSTPPFSLPFKLDIARAISTKNILNHDGSRSLIHQSHDVTRPPPTYSEGSYTQRNAQTMRVTKLALQVALFSLDRRQWWSLPSIILSAYNLYQYHSPISKLKVSQVLEYLPPFPLFVKDQDPIDIDRVELSYTLFLPSHLSAQKDSQCLVCWGDNVSYFDCITPRVAHCFCKQCMPTFIAESMRKFDVTRCFMSGLFGPRDMFLYVFKEDEAGNPVRGNFSLFTSCPLRCEAPRSGHYWSVKYTERVQAPGWWNGSKGRRGYKVDSENPQVHITEYSDPRRIFNFLDKVLPFLSTIEWISAIYSISRVVLAHGKENGSLLDGAMRVMGYVSLWLRMMEKNETWRIRPLAVDGLFVLAVACITLGSHFSALKLLLHINPGIQMTTTSLSRVQDIQILTTHILSSLSLSLFSPHSALARLRALVQMVNMYQILQKKSSAF